MKTYSILNVSASHPSIYLPSSLLFFSPYIPKKTSEEEWKEIGWIMGNFIFVMILMFVLLATYEWSMTATGDNLAFFPFILVSSAAQHEFASDFFFSCFLN